MTFVSALSMTSGDMLVAFHCSGSTGGQWRGLRGRLGDGFLFHAPDMAGTPRADHWTGRRAFPIAHEVAEFLAAIDRHDGPVHVAGHSYGGAVALHLAAARRERIASLTLYEPSAFYLLKAMGEVGQAAFDEIEAVARRLHAAAAEPNLEGGAEGFVDYWNTPGAYRTMTPKARAAIAASMPKVVLEFEAVFAERLTMSDFAGFRFPVLVIEGDRSPAPTRLIARGLGKCIASAIVKTVAGAGHMGPLTHPDIIAESMARHIATTAVTAGARSPDHATIPTYARGAANSG